jgi:hypothetical protein
MWILDLFCLCGGKAAFSGTLETAPEVFKLDKTSLAV